MLVLRTFRMEDAPDLAQSMNNLNVQVNLRDGIPYPYTTADAEAYITGVLSAPTDSQYVWVIEIDGKVAGNLGFFRKENVHRLTAELGYYIGEAFWGRGYMTEAVRRGCEMLFEQTDILRIFAEPFAHNAASCRVLEKAGFVLEGILRKNVVKSGQVMDMCLYALVR